MTDKYPRRPASRRSRTARTLGASATALALAGLVAGSGQTTQAAQPAPVAQTAPVAQAAAPSGALMVVEGGRSVGATTPENARRDGLTVVDLSDDWLQNVFSEEPGKPQPLRPYLVDLANGRMRPNKTYARAREDRFFEAFGISPSLNLVRRRLADTKRHACHDRVKDAVLEELSPKNVIPPEEPEKVPNPDPATIGEKPMILTGRTISPRPLTADEKRAVIAMQAHLRCEDLLSGKATPGRMDRRTVEGLKIYQRLQMTADSGRVDLETRTTLLDNSREQDFRALLRVLRERVVDATGLLEDGSALGVQGQVQGRTLDSAEFQPLAAQAPNPPSPAPSSPAQAPPAQGKPAAAAEASAKITPAADLIGAATQAASQALGWTSPDAVLASTLVVPPTPPPGSRRPGRKTAAPRGPVPLPSAVAVRLPPLPSYHGPKMELRAEIDRGEVVLARPSLDKDGKKKWKPPVSDRPTLTLYARVGDREVALSRWPTTIGGWKTIQKSDGSMALKYKESVTGDALWSGILATPTWHPGSGLPTRKLLVKRGDTWEPKTEIIGPGYRAAYGLVAIVHHQIEGVNERGEQQLMDHRIRTHGTPAYRSVKRGESSGCHRLHNQLALRLAGFLVRHRAHVRQGLVPEDYVRNLKHEGQEIALTSENKGYRFELTPPVPVTVLDGDVRGDAKAVKRVVPLAIVP
ncbi:MAG TPA: hypothetical protein VFH73_15665 [Polyangia bacterium]|nr:hypothetical protein [Polyangia bacterium]